MVEQEILTEYRPKGPKEVILTGTFDNWSKSLYLVKQADGSFELTVPLPSDSDKILYKYIVDGDWLVSPNDKISKDLEGNENNCLEASDLVALNGIGEASIPESGGLPVKTSTAPGNKDVNTTVLPTSEGQQTTLVGEPGIQVPKDPAAISAFTEVRDVDPKTLNEPPLTSEEKKKQKKKVKRSQYKAKKKKKAAEAVVGTSGTGTSATETSDHDTEPERATPEPSSKEGAFVPLSLDQIKSDTEKDKLADKRIDDIAVAPGRESAWSNNESPEVSKEPKQSDDEAKEKATEAFVAAAGAAGVVGATSAVLASEAGAPKDIPQAGSNAEPETAGKTGGSLNDGLPIEPNPTPISPSVAAVKSEKIDDLSGGDLKDLTASKLEEPTVSEPNGDASAVVVTSATETVPKTLDPNAHEADEKPGVLSSEEPVTQTNVTALESQAEGEKKPDTTTGLRDEVTPEKEVDAEPISKSEKSLVNDDEEIVIAQGSLSQKELAAAIAAQEGDVTVEEIKPTVSEAARLKEEAKLQGNPSKTAPETETSPSKTPAKTLGKEKVPKKEGEKKKGGLSKFLKKIFK
ncbi:uncharacterized protein PRCAT00004061001 [Priceomyces carsonii]|uniref:uncharacterized protein n=1 Tax=Priceomyces carsonii TaxID=28549 RepID=UPI002EDA02CF|nr:unnamed protein product [Priceomyces carsonii]